MGRRIVVALLVLVIVGAAVWLLGPRVPVDTTVTFDGSTIGDDTEAYLASRESSVANIRPDHQKEVIWADPSARAKTPLAIVYVHGFSASKFEVRPLPDRIATALGANLYFTRLTGHGQDGPAMATASVNAWVNDYAEALSIGRAIGERVVVIATSSGGSIASWAATDPAFATQVAALVLISPNYGVRAAGASLLTGPWGRQLAGLLIGPERGFEPANELHARYWTYRYPTVALLPMGAVTELAYDSPVERSKVPALFVFSDADTVVRAERTREIAGRWGAIHESVSVETSGDPSNHVIAGDALSPSTTQPLADAIVAWLRVSVDQIN
ncbi:MAG: alpha/beta hydrolase [Rhizobiaceae bacterium]